VSKRAAKKKRIYARHRREIRWLDDNALQHLKLLPPENCKTATFDFENQFGLALRINVGGQEVRHAVRTLTRGLRHKRGKLGTLLRMEMKLMHWLNTKFTTYSMDTP
jgi:hypothetical protein